VYSVQSAHQTGLASTRNVSIHALEHVHQTANVELLTTNPFVVAQLVTPETDLAIASHFQLLVRMNFEHSTNSLRILSFLFGFHFCTMVGTS
jgi:hypothetical protein